MAHITFYLLPSIIQLATASLIFVNKHIKPAEFWGVKNDAARTSKHKEKINYSKLEAEILIIYHQQYNNRASTASIPHLIHHPFIYLCFISLSQRLISVLT